MSKREPRVSTKPRSPSDASENQIHSAIIARLQWCADPSVFYFHVPNGGYRTPREAARFKSFGVRPGVPDLILLRRGQVFALEIKAKSGKLSPHQKTTLRRMEAAGAVVAVAFGLDDAIRQLEEWRVL
jgi:hypothetical protein